MKKRFRNQLCAYCNEHPATTADHVIGRKFFPVHLRGNLPQAPACTQCNCEKSDLEQYAMTVFPFGSEHHSSQEMLTKEVPGRLDENQRLRRELQEGQRKVLINERGQAPQGTISLPLDWQKSSLLFEMITKGLIWHHFGVGLPTNYVVRILPFIKTRLQFFSTRILTLNQENLTSLSLADGGFNYTFTRNSNDPGFTAWILDFYKTLNICRTTDQGELVRLYICALTGPPEISRIADTLQCDAA